MILPRFSLCTTMQRAESSKLLFERRPGLWAMALISIAQVTIQALIQPLGETRRQDWRLCTKTTRRGYQPHLWSVDSSHVELAVRRLKFGRWSFSIYETCARSGNGPYYNCPSHYCLSELSIPNGTSEACAFKVCLPIGLYVNVFKYAFMY